MAAHQPPGMPAGMGQQMGAAGGGAAGGRLDIITQNTGENIRRVQARDLGASVVQAVFRLAKQATLHSLDNQAVVRQVEDAAAVINDYGNRTDQNISILFAFGSIFVGGQLLKANRLTYDGAVELGEILKKFGYSELMIARNVTAQDLFAFVAAIAESQRSGRGQQLEKPSVRIRLRAVAESALKRGAVVERLDERQAVVRMYASAIVIMRRFFEQLQRGRYDLPQRVKRIAQVLVDLSQGETPAFLGVTAARNANQDEAGRAVNTAILSVAMARQITDDIVILARIGMAALLYDTARPRLTNTVGPNPPAIMPRLSEFQELEQPAATAAVLTALGHVNEPTVMRTVLAYEAHWLRKAKQLGPLYQGMRPATLQARVVLIARKLNDLLTPAPGADAMSADDAIATLESEAADPAEGTVIRLLVSALGIFPTGTLVQLGSNEMALVVSTPAHPSQYSQPRVRIMFDSAGGRLHQPIDLDLASLGAQDSRKTVQKIVSPADDASRAQARAARSGPRNPTAEQPSGHSSPSHISAPSAPSAFTPSGVSGLAPSPSPALHPSAVPAARPSGTYPSNSPHAQPQVARAPTPAPAADPQQAAAQAAYAAQYAEWERQKAAYDQAQAQYEAELAAYHQAQAAQAAQQAYEQQQQAYQQQQYNQGGYSQPPDPFAPEPYEADDDDGATQARDWQGGAFGDTSHDEGASTKIGDSAAIAAAVRRSQEIEVDGGGSAPRTGRTSPSYPRSPTPPPAEASAPAAEEPPAPTAEGNLTKTPLVHLLVYMLDQRLTGTALFQTPDGVNHGIYFEKGVPSKVRTGGMVAPLDRVLLEMGLLDEQTLRQSLMEVSKKKVLHGRFLVSKGLLDGGTILKVLKQQILRKLIHLFELDPETRYAFYADYNLLANYGGPELTPVEPLSLIMTGVRMRSDDPLVEATLQRLGKRALGLHIDAEVKRFEFRKEESAVVDLMRIKKMSVEDIIGHGVAHESVARLTLYVLAVTRHIEIAGVTGRPPIGVTLRDRIRRSGVVEPGPVAIREAAQASSPPPPEAAAAPEGQKGLGIDFSRLTPKPGAMGVRPGESGAPAPEPAYAPPPQPAYAPPPPQQPAYAPPPPPPQAAFAPPPPQPAYAPPPPQQPAYAPPPPQQPAYAPPPPPQAAFAPPPQQPAYAPPPPPQAAFAPPPAQHAAFAPPPPQHAAFTPPPPQAAFAPSSPPAAFAPPAPGASAPGRSGPPPHLSQDLQHRWQEIELRDKRIDDENFFEMLGVTQEAKDQDVQAAYFKLAKAWHPDRIPAELAPLKGVVSKIFTKFNEAYAVLSDAAKRADYAKTVAQGGGTSAEMEEVQRVVDAALEFQKAEVLLKKGDLNQAEAYAKRALASDPGQMEYRCVVAWISAMKRGDPPVVPEGKTSSFYNDVIQIFDDILKTDAMYERCLYYRGVLLKRTGQEEKAIRDFRMVVQLNPKNIDAVREVRLHQMRRDKKRKDEAGLIGKIFKK
ncbi:MAG: DnaJ domain-containing protein [Polyangiaceae bacterium]|nr:DnaJ domain-containing protein [Polyangiaceae bacterium]